MSSGGSFTVWIKEFFEDMLKKCIDPGCMISNLEPPKKETISKKFSSTVVTAITAGGLSIPLRTVSTIHTSHDQWMTQFKILSILLRCIIRQVDIKSAFRLLPMHPSDCHLITMEWNHQIYTCRYLHTVWLLLAPKLFSILADPLSWIAQSYGPSREPILSEKPGYLYPTLQKFRFPTSS